VATSPQRAYRAACPNCGAPVEFASAASASAVCSFCRSTLVRDGEALRRIGVSAELFDDHSPLQLGAAGSYKGMAFTLVGRLQYGYADGTWNEWHALFDSGRSGWLSEDNGAYVFAFDAQTPVDAPRADEIAAGQPRLLDGRPWTVASVVRTKLIAAQGELPFPPPLDAEFVVADLRSEADEVATLDYGDARRTHWSVGRGVLLADLKMSGLREESEKKLSGRAFDCPSCGNALEPKLATTQSLACGSCKAVVDISKGVGGELQHYAQNNSGAGGLEPQIPLGASGKLALGAEQAVPWQVVGYMERCDLPEPGSDDEQTFWREYLLYNRDLGFAFLVDAEDGWSWVRPITGAPKVRGEEARWGGTVYKKRYSYRAKVTWVQGEFYWRVRRDEEARVTDYDGTGSVAAARKRLSYEKTASEVTWSAGEALDANVVATAFELPPDKAAALRRDATPLSFDAGKAKSIATKVMVALVFLVVINVLLATCSSSDDCNQIRQSFGEASPEYQQCLRSAATGTRTRGGSFGGYSSGGGHK